jgi:tRNA(Ile)-lysidine synthase TilS/MesJ
VAIIHVVSVSGGKDSLATLLIALARFGLRAVLAVVADTGNEHADTFPTDGHEAQDRREAFDLLGSMGSPACSSSYGLCE